MNLKKYINKTKWFFVATLAIFFSSCDDFLDMQPLDKMTQKEMWQTKEDVNKSLISAYDAVQECTPTFFRRSEMRGELLKSENDPDKNMYRQQITENSSYTSWSKIYAAINKINTVYAFAPQAQAIDATFSKQELDYFLGECLAMRAMCYFYLARTYQDLPYITKGSLTDDEEFIYSPSTNIAVLDSCEKTFLAAEKLVRANWDGLGFSDINMKTRYTKGRFTKPVIAAFLADLYVTKAAYCEDAIDGGRFKGDKVVEQKRCYENAIKYADKVINNQNPKYMLNDIADWMDSFYPGNSKENIFDIQYMRSATFADVGWLYDAFKHDFRWQRSTVYNTFSSWEGEEIGNTLTDDQRGLGRSFTASAIWKFTGIDFDEQGDESKERKNYIHDAINYPIYRLAEMYLIKAEAYNRLDNREQAISNLLTIRHRGIPSAGRNRPNKEYFWNLDPAMSMEDFEDELLNERAAELAAEGKRWYDLMRIALVQHNPDVIIDRVVNSRANEAQRPVWKARLYRQDAWFFPINRTELDNNAKLKQNKFYSTSFGAND